MRCDPSGRWKHLCNATRDVVPRRMLLPGTSWLPSQNQLRTKISWAKCLYGHSSGFTEYFALVLCVHRLTWVKFQSTVHPNVGRVKCLHWFSIVLTTVSKLVLFLKGAQSWAQPMGSFLFLGKRGIAPKLTTWTGAVTGFLCNGAKPFHCIGQIVSGTHINGKMRTVGYFAN